MGVGIKERSLKYGWTQRMEVKLKARIRGEIVGSGWGKPTDHGT